MSRSPIGVFAIALIVLAGCNQGTPGGEGASGTSAQGPLHRQAENSFNLSVPLLRTSIKQGETQAISIGIKRATNFQDDVTLEFVGLPEGLTFSPSRPVIKHGDAEAKVMLAATRSATLGDFTVSVTGHPPKGADATVTMTIQVEK